MKLKNKSPKKKRIKIDYIKKFLKEKFIIFKNFIIKNKEIIFMALPFIAMDLITRILGKSINFYKVYRFVPNFFTIIWIFLFLGIVLSFKKKIGKWIYLGINIIFLIVFLVNNVYFSMMNNYFSFTLLEAAGEGAPYILDAIINCNILVYISFLFIIGLIVLGFKHIKDNEKFEKERLVKVIIIFLIAHLITPIFLGKANTDLVWSTWKNPRNVYNLYNDSNKSLRVSGLFEYTFRDFYITFLKIEKENTEDLEFLKEEFSKEASKSDNKYTGIFEGKNLIFLQLEGVDNWLLNKEDTPTLYNMMQESIKFNNHYSFYNGGGSTFNSEFAVNTGYIMPLSYNKNAYTFNQNSFPYSMAKLFKDLDYKVNAFHMNTGEYYSRSINYKNFGYDNYYGLLDMYKYDDEKYTLDRELIENIEYSDLMFPEDSLFVDYIITYSSHLPFTNTKGVCKLLYEEDNVDKDIEFTEMSEEECARRQVSETDYMVKLLLQKLKEKKLDKNTIIVVFTDHYLYTLEDQTILDKYKTTSNNLINKTPFFIYDGGKTKTTVKSVTSQIDILPTVLNLFGIDYDIKNYIGSDALNSSYKGIVFFSDYSWYDGNVYVQGGEVINNKKISKTQLEEKNLKINYLAKKNDLVLKYDYFKKVEKENKPEEKKEEANSN